MTDCYIPGDYLRDYLGHKKMSLKRVEDQLTRPTVDSGKDWTDKTTDDFSEQKSDYLKQMEIESARLNDATSIDTFFDTDSLDFLHQLILLTLIIGKWMLPNPNLTRDQLSQVLFIFIGAGLDIIEFITETRKVLDCLYLTVCLQNRLSFYYKKFRTHLILRPLKYVVMLRFPNLLL